MALAFFPWPLFVLLCVALACPLPCPLDLALGLALPFPFPLAEGLPLSLPFPYISPPLLWFRPLLLRPLLPIQLLLLILIILPTSHVISMYVESWVVHVDPSPIYVYIGAIKKSTGVLACDL